MSSSGFSLSLRQLLPDVTPLSCAKMEDGVLLFDSHQNTRLDPLDTVMIVQEDATPVVPSRSQMIHCPGNWILSVLLMRHE
jgi:hypothetical protein